MKKNTLARKILFHIYKKIEDKFQVIKDGMGASPGSYNANYLGMSGFFIRNGEYEFYCQPEMEIYQNEGKISIGFHITDKNYETVTESKEKFDLNDPQLVDKILNAFSKYAKLNEGVTLRYEWDPKYRMSNMDELERDPKFGLEENWVEPH